MSKIAFIHNALGKTDGVSLEVDKWRQVCRKLGHEVFYIAGNTDVEGILCIRELDFYEEKTYKILKNATVKLEDYENEQALEEDIYLQKNIIKEKLKKILHEYQIDIIIPNNLMSVGYHIPALVALAEIMEETGIRTIQHNHDFYFEDSGEVNPTCEAVEKLLHKYAPMTGENIENVVINEISKRELLHRKNIAARIVPNVFDFRLPPWQRDSYNMDLRDLIGLKKNDIMVLQATRILDRKGIELAIDVVAALNQQKSRLFGKCLYNGEEFTEESGIVLVCGGYVETFGISGDYYNNLCMRAKAKGVDIRFIGDRIKHSRGVDYKGKLYSLWDCYVEADVITYPSIWEGWGNQFIEAVFAKLPIVLFEYPVFLSDLKKDGFSYVSLGSRIVSHDAYGLVEVDAAILENAASEVLELLQDTAKRKAMVERNYEIAQSKYSLEALEDMVKEMI